MSETTASDAFKVARVSSGIAGLDTILEGGFLAGGIYIIQGPPGAGKTIFGNQACFNHAAHGRKALYVTLLAESHSRMMMHMSSLGFFDATAIPEGVYYLSAFQELEQNSLSGLIGLLRREIRRHGADLLVLDGLVAAESRAGTDMEFKKFIHELQSQAAVLDCTMFLLTSIGSRPVAAEHTMVDGVIELTSRLYGWRAERDLQVLKRRGSGYLPGRHAFRITDAGIVVYPRIEALLARPSRLERVEAPPVSTGVDMLDTLSGGGLPAFSTTLLVGPVGCGKTTLGLQFLGASSVTEPGLFLGFHETEQGLRAKSRALGLVFEDLVDNGAVEVLWSPATEILLDEACALMLETVKRRGIKRLFIDGLESFHQLATDPARVSHIFAALAAELRAREVTTIYTAETETLGIGGMSALGGPPVRNVSSIAENVLAMRFVEHRAELCRLISVMKTRDGQVDTRLRLFEIGMRGISVDASPERAATVLREAAGQTVRVELVNGGDTRRLDAGGA